MVTFLLHAFVSRSPRPRRIIRPSQAKGALGFGANWNCRRPRDRKCRECTHLATRSSDVTGGTFSVDPGAKPKDNLSVTVRVRIGPEFGGGRFAWDADLFAKRGSRIRAERASWQFGGAPRNLRRKSIRRTEYRCSPWPGPAPSIVHQSVINTARVAR